MDDFVRCVNTVHNSTILSNDYKHRVMQHCVNNYFEPYSNTSGHITPWLRNLEYSTLYPYEFNYNRLHRHRVRPYNRAFYRGFKKGYRKGSKQKES